MGMSNIARTIENLQGEKILPSGSYIYEFWEEQFSQIFKVVIGDCRYYFKYLKQMKGHSRIQLINKIEQEYYALKKLEPVFARFEKFNIPQVVYVSNEDLLLVTKEIQGESIKKILDEYMFRFNPLRCLKKNIIIKLAKNIGKISREINESEKDNLLVEDIDFLRGYIEERLFNSNFFTYSEEIEISNFVTRGYSSLVSRIDLYSKNLVHGDLNPANIFFDGDEIGIIDFGNCTMGNNYQDICTFHMMMFDLFMVKIKHGYKYKKEIFDAFCEGYGVQFNEISNDIMYKMTRLKNLSIYLKTFSYRLEEPFAVHLSLKMFNEIMARFVDYIDFIITKRSIIRLVRESENATQQGT